MPHASEPSTASSGTECVDVACTLCGCICDDLRLTVAEGRVQAVEPRCALADPWLLAQKTHEQTPVAYCDGRPASIASALTEATAILRNSISPLIYGLSRSSTPGQRAAVQLADRLGATIDTTASTCHAPSIMALQSVGESTSSLGEVRNRSDLVVYWGSNPLLSHPRHLQRFVDAPGEFVPRGRADRQVVVVDIEPTETAAVADRFFQVRPGEDFELLWALRAALRGLPLDDDEYGGIASAEVYEFAEQFKSAHYGAVFFGLGLTRHGLGHANVEALLSLVTDVNHRTRCIARRMRVPGDVAGADSVLCWQTGYPFSVNLGRGYPRYNPGEFTANGLLERAEVDAVVFVGAEGVSKLSPAARATLTRLPLIILDYPETDWGLHAQVQFTTAVYGIHREGTAYRMDEVPIPLRAVLHSPLPADHEILDALCERLA